MGLLLQQREFEYLEARLLVLQYLHDILQQRRQPSLHFVNDVLPRHGH